jgi:MFS family permease
VKNPFADSPEGKASSASVRLPANVAALGVVSLLMASSSQMTHSLLPLYLVSVMGASTAMVGLIEGLAEATNSILRAFAGAISDWMGRRKPLVVLGYGLSACVKPVFPLASDVWTILLARIFDRTGKGIRDAPRDALLADQVPAKTRGAGYGLRLSFFTIGSCIGPLLAVGLMSASDRNFRLVFWVAIFPAVLSVLVLIVKVEEAPNSHANTAKRFSAHQLRRLPIAFWWVVGIGCVIALSRFSQAFLLLKAKDVGVSTAFVPAFLALMSLVYGLAAYPFGILADHVDRRLQLGVGIVVLVACHLVLGGASSSAVVVIGAVLWGLQLGIIDGLLAASVADTAPDDLRGTAFGAYYLLIGVASLAASAMAGVLWGIGGASSTFSAGAVLAGLAMLLLIAGRSLIPIGEARQIQATPSP